MSFISLEFLVFLLITLIVYWGTPSKYRWVILLISNYVFYSFAGIEYIVILLYITVASYFLPIIICKYKKQGKSKLMLALGVVLILTPLLFFKYSGFIQENLSIIIKSLNSATLLSEMKIVLPLGISFYTFSALSYVIDTTRDKSENEYSFLQYAAALSFFPCLVSGPIERQKNLLKQIIKTNTEFDYTKASYGLKLIAVGIYKKAVIADNLAVYVDAIWNDLRRYNGIVLLIAIFFYSIQIYCDFSGYSDIARGIAKLLSIEITMNFDSPYFSGGFQEFWRRWHISLSTWFRDYVYIPLGGSRHGKINKVKNVIITMLISGLWHGAAWKYILWGGMHGALQAIESFLTKKYDDYRIIKAAKVAFVFAMCSFLWVFFRANNISDAFYVFTHIFSYTTGAEELIGIGLVKKSLLVIAFEIGVLVVYDAFSLKCDVINEISGKSLIIRWLIYVLFLIVIAQFSYKASAGVFVYAGF